jgi:hypothetical protein
MDKLLRLKDKGIYRFTHSADPQIIIWENTGAPLKHKIKMFIEIYSIAAIIFLITFAGFWAIQLFEKLRDSYVMSDCSGNSYYGIDAAFIDFNLPKKENQMQGLMNCYCRQMYDLYDTQALKIKFEDGEQYCKNWYTQFFFADYVNFIQAAWIAIVNYVVQ